jgi:hypothetical protein
MSYELETVYEAANSIAFSDLLSKSIRVNGNWNLLPLMGFTSSIYPTELVSYKTPSVKFP